ncbi:MAG: hypothetical protein AAF790_05660 [Planctomycetota bacterium]
MSDAARIEHAGGLVLSVYREGDRFQHRVSAGDAAWESAPRDMLDTPVFTELHQQGDVVFLSGNAGFGHCSASIEPCDAGFFFDVACRVTSPTPAVASFYRGEGLTCSPSADDSMVRPAENERSMWVVESTEPIGPLPCLLRCRYTIGR